MLQADAAVVVMGAKQLLEGELVEGESVAEVQRVGLVEAAEWMDLQEVLIRLLAWPEEKVMTRCGFHRPTFGPFWLEIADLLGPFFLAW